MKLVASRNKREGKFLVTRRDNRTYQAKYSTKKRTSHYTEDYLNRITNTHCNCGVNHE